MYVLSISSVSEVLMVQFAFSNSYRTHIDSRSFVHFFLTLFVGSRVCRACAEARAPFSFTLIHRTNFPYFHRQSDRFESNGIERSIRHRHHNDTIDRSVDPGAPDRSARSIASGDPRHTHTHRPRTNQLSVRAVSSHYAACFRLFVSRLSELRACVCTCVRNVLSRANIHTLPRPT